MSDSNQGDPFGNAKGNLRETIKWLVTAFAALAAAIVAGASLTGLHALEGRPLAIASLGGLLAISCILFATGLTLRLLTSEAFHFGQLEADQDLKARLDQHAIDLLPPEIESIDELITLRRNAITEIRNSKNDPQGEKYKSASKFYQSIDQSLLRITSFAHFIVLCRRLERKLPILFVLAIGAFIGLALFATFATSADKDTRPRERLLAQFDPGKGWIEIAKALSNACGDTPTAVSIEMAGSPKWLKVLLQEPSNCGGLEITLPADLILRLLPSTNSAPRQP